MASIWTLNTGSRLGVFAENATIRFALPLNTASNTISNVKVISGELPGGLRIDGLYVVGTPFEVARVTESKFVLRATASDGSIEDRTFTILIDGPDEPTWTTKQGLLQVDPNSKYFVLDNTVVDFQLQAIDPDLPAGDTLQYYIEDDDGDLPPGLKLTIDGRIVGVVEPVLALDKRAGSGHYDANIYGTFPFDFGERSANGFDSFFYDTRIYDDKIPTRQPRKLNRYYEFIVTVTDGDTFTKRKFQIYLVGDDFLRADNTKMQIANGLFTADNTYLRTPLWLTPANLGFRRANNYLTFFLDVLDTETIAGRLQYTLETLNDDGSTSTLPDGMSLDSTTGEIAGRVPYQPAVTKEYKFTVKATRLGGVPETILASKNKTFTVKILGEIDSTISWQTASNLGNISANFISTLSVKATTTVPDSRLIYSLQSGSLPPGLSLDISGEIIGKVNQFGTAGNPGLTVFDNGTLTLDGSKTILDREFKFTVRAEDRFGYSAIDREFTIDVLDPDDNLYSNLYMKPFMKQNIRDQYTSFISDPNIFPPDLIYRSGDPEFGVQKDIKMLAYAGILTQNIRNYVAASAKNHKRKTFQIGELKKAVAKNPGSNDTVYEVIYLEVIDPYMPTKGDVAKTVTVTKGDKITVDSVQFETLNDNTALGSGSSSFDLQIRGVGTPTLKVSSIGNDLEIVTRSGRVVFPTVGNITVTLRSGSSVISEQVFEITQAEPYRFRPINNTLKVDSDALTVGNDSTKVKYVSNIKNMRDRISETGVTERDFLPLWMRTAQENSVQELGYITAIPIAYCKSGSADQILLNIKNRNFDFKTINMDIDRYTVDSTTGNSNEQYILFANYDYNI